MNNNFFNICNPTKFIYYSEPNEYHNNYQFEQISRTKQNNTNKENKNLKLVQLKSVHLKLNDLELDDLELDDLELDDLELDDLELDDLESDDSKSVDFDLDLDDLKSSDLESDNLESDNLESYHLEYFKISRNNFISSSFYYKNKIKLLFKEIFEKKEFNKGVTSKIKCISSKFYFDFINRYYFNKFYFSVLNYDIINHEFLNYIKTLHKICSSSTGTFLEYLSRRIICVIIKINFDDDKIKNYINLKNNINHIGNTEHICSNKCTFNNNFITKKCINFCYYKVQNIDKFKTKDIIEDILIISFAHTIFHTENNKRKINKNKFSKILDELKKINMCKFVYILENIFTILINNKKNIYLNYKLNYSNIYGESDIIIDDILFELKCVKSYHSILLQLLVYMALLKVKYNINIKLLCIINFYDGTIKFYNVEGIEYNDLYEFLKLFDKEINYDYKSISVNKIFYKNNVKQFNYLYNKKYNDYYQIQKRFNIEKLLNISNPPNKFIIANKIYKNLFFINKITNDYSYTNKKEINTNDKSLKYILILDIETTGVPKTNNFNDYYSPENVLYYKDARIIEIGYVLCDEEGKIKQKKEFLIKPNNFIINNSDIHGITNEHALNEGIDINLVLSEFYNNLREAHTIVTYNSDFDINIILSECYRLNNLELINYIKSKKIDCAMKLATSKLGLVKNIKLSLLHYTLYNITTDVKHRALYDTKLCKNCYFHLLNNY